LPAIKAAIAQREPDLDSISSTEGRWCRAGRELVTSPAYQQLWGDRFTITKTGKRRLENNQTGFKLATVGSRPVNVATESCWTTP
jgi:hypothetical protein